MIITDNILTNRTTHLVELFKDYLLYVFSLYNLISFLLNLNHLIDYKEEFLKKHYKTKEISEIINNLYIFYKKYLYFFVSLHLEESYIIIWSLKEKKEKPIYIMIIFKNKKKKINVMILKIMH